MSNELKRFFLQLWFIMFEGSFDALGLRAPRVTFEDRAIVSLLGRSRSRDPYLTNGNHALVTFRVVVIESLENSCLLIR
jgi:hypothetical protein